MKLVTQWKSLILGALVLGAPLFVSAQEETAVNLDSEISKQSYAVGADIASNMKRSGLELDLAAFIAAFQAAHNEEDLAMSDEELAASLQALGQKMQAAAAERQAEMQKGQMEAGLKAQEEGVAFLAENAKKEGFVTTDSGLQYKVLEEGSGASPAASDKVKVHYTGTFINGEKFDSSVDRGEPAEFGVDQVIAGWTEALQLMKVGAKWQLAIPSELGYGQGGRGIPPNSVLLFDVELLDIIK